MDRPPFEAVPGLAWMPMWLRESLRWSLRVGGALGCAALGTFMADRIAEEVGLAMGALVPIDAQQAFRELIAFGLALPGYLLLMAVGLYGAAFVYRLSTNALPQDELRDQQLSTTLTSVLAWSLLRGLYLAPGIVLAELAPQTQPAPTIVLGLGWSLAFPALSAWMASGRLSDALLGDALTRELLRQGPAWTLVSIAAGVGWALSFQSDLIDNTPLCLALDACLFALLFWGLHATGKHGPPPA